MNKYKSLILVTSLISSAFAQDNTVNGSIAKDNAPTFKDNDSIFCNWFV